jgi:hypothetical protein
MALQANEVRRDDNRIIRVWVEVRRLLSKRKIGGANAQLFISRQGRPLEDHELNLPNDTAAIHEGLITASGMLRDLEFSGVGKLSEYLEITEEGVSLFQIEIHAKRSR